MAHDSDARRFDRSNEFKGFRNISASLTPWGDCLAVLECCNIVTHDIMFDVSSAEHCLTVLT